MSRPWSGVVLLLLAVLGMGATYLTHIISAPGIAVEQRRIDSRHLLDLLPANSYDNQPLEQTLSLDHGALAHSTLLGGYLATQAGRPSAVLLRSQTAGYAGAIELLIVIDPNGRLMGVKTLKQMETPGLGARIADWPNAWLQRFTGKDGDGSEWALIKDQGEFDQIAGATITSRAVIAAIHDALSYFDEHRRRLLGAGAHE